DPSGSARAQRHPRQLRGARLDRVSRRYLGEAQERQSEALQPHPGEHSFRPARAPRGGRERRPVPGLAARELGHGTDHHRGRRAAAYMSVDGRTRDFVGYGGSPPDPKWPNGARLALNFVMNYEEGSEPSIDDGDGYTEAGLTEGASLDPLRERRDL